MTELGIVVGIIFIAVLAVVISLCRIASECDRKSGYNE